MFIFRKLSRTVCTRHTLLALLLLLIIYVIQHKPIQPNNVKQNANRPHFNPSCQRISKLSTQPNKKVLLLGESTHTCDNVRVFLESNRIEYKHIKNLVDQLETPELYLYDSQSKPNIIAVVFCSFSLHNHVTKQSYFSDLTAYSLKYNVGQIILPKIDDDALVHSALYSSKVDMSDHHQYYINDGTMLHVTKYDESNVVEFGESLTVNIIESINGTIDETIATIYHRNKHVPIVKHLCSSAANPSQIVFGLGLNIFTHRLLFLDALHYSSGGVLAASLTRNIQVDIDDIFVGAAGTRIGSSDVDAMIAFQQRWNKKVDNFHFVVGFSGKFIYRGNETENAGDKYLLEKKDEFRWFGHMWSHMQSIMFENEEKLCSYMQQNRDFAVRHALPMETGYAVAPHHAGVYPVHEPLYHCWREIWGVTITSTEEYPHLRPDRFRRGFIHQGLRVLPRQTCGLFTHTLFYDKFPGGPAKLEASIQGGELFTLILTNPFNIFMTHLQNYGSDRLSLYAFEHLFKFVNKWTNLRLSQIPPAELATSYFEQYPIEAKSPQWTNPCDDKRHLEILPEAKRDKCKNLPDFVILGPQKTGTTALMSFLKYHPMIESSHDSPYTFEELQFFSGQYYEKGLNWYMDLFPERNNRTIKIFEKSATYFDSYGAASKIKALLPNAQLIAVLLEPGERAYSWYQHQKAHAVDAAMKYSFYEILQSTESDPVAYGLKQRCLEPGLYARHLRRWFERYSGKQLIVLDGNKLKSDPIPLMNRLQKQLHVTKYYDYRKLIKFDEKKGFFCPLQKGKTHCLGKSKGRRYEEMDAQSRAYLDDYFSSENGQLKELLEKHSKVLPEWLQVS